MRSARSCPRLRMYWIYFFDFIPMCPGAKTARAYSEITHVPRRMFLLRIIARATTPISLLSPFRRSPLVRFYFPVDRPPSSPRSTSPYLATPHFPVEHRRCSFLKKHVLVENVVRLSLAPSIIPRKSFINMVYTPSNPLPPPRNARFPPPQRIA